MLMKMAKTAYVCVRGGGGGMGTAYVCVRG